MGERERFPRPLPQQDIPLRRCQWRYCPKEAVISVYNRVLDECLPDDAPIAIIYSCDRHARAIAYYCHAVDEDITYIGPY
jgi:hypothetical protein